MEQGGPFIKINMNKLHRFYFCRKYGSKRMRDLKGHLTLLTLTLLYRNKIGEVPLLNLFLTPHTSQLSHIIDLVVCRGVCKEIAITTVYGFTLTSFT